MVNIGGGSPKGGEKYWNKNFVQGAKDYFHDYNTPYFVNTDYSYMSSASNRTEQGMNGLKITMRN